MSNGRKRHLRRAVALLGLLALAAICWHVSRTRSDTPVIVQMPDVCTDGTRDVLRGEISLEALQSGRVTGELVLRAVNRTGRDQTTAVLRTLAGTSARVVLSDVTVNGEAAVCRAQEDGLSAQIGLSWPAGETVDIGFRYELTVPEGAYPVGTDGGMTLAVCALPTLATWNGEAWDTDVDALMETGYAEAFDAELRFLIPRGWRLAFGGAAVEEGDGCCTVRMTGARDVSFAVKKDGVLRTRAIGGVQVSALASGGAQAERLLRAAGTALESLSKAGIPYPFATLAVVQADTGFEDGVIGSGLVALAGQKDQEVLLQRLTRLIARQTFGILVENDPFHEPWLSVSLASVCELMAFRQRRGEAACEERFMETVDIASRLTRPRGVTVGAPADSFGSDAEMTQVLRDQGGAMLMGIETAVGQEAFMRALSRYTEENAGKIAAQGQLERALLDMTGSAWDGYLSDELTY